MHPTKSKFMLSGSSYNLSNKSFEHPVIVNNTPVSQTDTRIKCLGAPGGAQIYEELTRDRWQY